MATSSELAARLEQAWQDLGIEDIGCGLRDHYMYSSSVAVTFLSRDIELAALRAITDRAIPLGTNWDSEYMHDYCIETIGDILSDDTRAFGHTSLHPLTTLTAWPPEAAERRITVDDVRAHYQKNWGLPNNLLQFPLRKLDVPSGSVLCIRRLQEEPDIAYRFCTEDHNHFVEKCFSFNEVLQQWNRASKREKRISNNLPEVRVKVREDGKKVYAVKHFEDCIVRCRCNECIIGEAQVWECKRYNFGSSHEILVHEFTYHDDGSQYKHWARILGTFCGSPTAYELWGAYKSNSKNITGYNEFFRLEEHVPRDGIAGQSEHSADISIHQGYSTRGIKRLKTSGQHSSVDSSPANSEIVVRGPNKSTNSASKSFSTPQADPAAPGHSVLDQDTAAQTCQPAMSQAQPATSAQMRQNPSDESDLAAANPLLQADQSRPNKGTPNAHREPSPTASTALDLGALYDLAIDHLCMQKEPGSSSSVLVTNEIINGMASDLDYFAKSQRESLFNRMWKQIDKELLKAGLERLPAP
ncbi:hypothetical protein Q7P37_001976 [Cladosporium fusiforme]